MKSFLHYLNIFKKNKNKNIKEIKQRLEKIDKKNDQLKEVEQKKRAKTEEWFAHWEKKRRKLWSTTFSKDYDFADELETIAKHVEKNTQLDVSLYYSEKDAISEGLIAFIIGKKCVSLTVHDEKTFKVRTYYADDNEDIDKTNFNFKDINKCKEFMKNQALKIYEEQT